MPSDPYNRLRALRALGAEGSGATPDERRLANQRADELEKKLNVNSPPRNDTTTTSRDGRDFTYGSSAWNEWAESMRRHNMDSATKIAEDLLKNQWRWNSEYYDQYGNPKPQPPAYTAPDEDDLYEEAWKYDPDYDEWDYEE